MSDTNKLRGIPFIARRHAAGASFAPLDEVACDRAVEAELRATIADVMHSRRGTVYRFGALLVALNGDGAFFGVGIESAGGVAGLALAGARR